MDYKVVMPRLSDSMEEGQLIEWKIKPGVVVKNGDVIAEVESDKAVMEIQTFKAGTVKEILIKPGTTVPIGTVMALIDTEGSTEKSDDQPKNDKLEIEKSHTTEKNKAASAVSKTVIPVRTHVSSQNAIDMLLDSSENVSQSSSFIGGNASPKARSLAAKYGLDIERLQKENKLPKPAHMADVKVYYFHRYFTPKALELIAHYHLSTDLFAVGKKHTETEVMTYIKAHEIPLPEPLDAVRKSMISIVNEAAKKPVYHMNDHIDAALLEQNATKKLTITVWLLKLIGEAMMQNENFRMTLGPNGMQLWPNASISLAMAHGNLLYMPVFKDINKKVPNEIADELRTFEIKLKQRKLTKEDMTGSTFGISNLGMTGIKRFDAMINKDDCGIAAVGSSIDGKISITLTIDHRIINGYQAAEFMKTLKTLAAKPVIFK